MPNDFLSSLSSRALQPAEVNSAGGGLKPRLASRFEHFNAPRVPAVDQVLDRESLVEVESRNDAGFTNPVLGSNRTPIVQKHEVPNEALGSGILTVPKRRSEETTQFFKQNAKPPMPNPLKPMAAADHSEASPLKSAPAPTERAELHNAAHENTQQPNTSPVSPRVESEKTIERHTKIVEVQSPSTNQEKSVPASVLPAAFPLSQTKVTPERIEVIRIERQAQSPLNGSQLVPSLELPALKSQSRLAETQEQPPTIHVTIGRIEVKAAPPAAAPTRRVPASPAMSLDEYLRRRAGGER